MCIEFKNLHPPSMRNILLCLPVVFAQFFTVPKVYADDIPSAGSLLQQVTFNQDHSVASIDILAKNVQGQDHEYINEVWLEFSEDNQSWKKLAKINRSYAGASSNYIVQNVAGTNFYIYPYLNSDETINSEPTGVKGQLGDVGRWSSGDNNFLKIHWVIPYELQNKQLTLRIKGSYTFDWGHNRNNFTDPIAAGITSVLPTYLPELNNPNAPYVKNVTAHADDNKMWLGNNKGSYSNFSGTSTQDGNKPEKRRLWRIQERINGQWVVLDAESSQFEMDEGTFDNTASWDVQDLTDFLFLSGPGVERDIRIQFFKFTLSGIECVTITADNLKSNNIRPPSSLVVQSENNFGIKITWEKGNTEIPDSNIRYKLFREERVNGVWVDNQKIYEQTINSDNDYTIYIDNSSEAIEGYTFISREYIDYDLIPSGLYRYTLIAEYIPDNDDYEAHASATSVSINSSSVHCSELPQISGFGSSSDLCNEIKLTYAGFTPGASGTTNLSNGFKLTNYKFVVKRKKSSFNAEQDLLTTISLPSNTGVFYTDTYDETSNLIEIDEGYDYFVYTQANLSSQNGVVNRTITNTTYGETTRGNLLSNFSSIENFESTETSDQEIQLSWELSNNHTFDKLLIFNGESGFNTNVEINDLITEPNNTNTKYSYLIDEFTTCNNYNFSIKIQNCSDNNGPSVTPKRSKISGSTEISITPNTQDIFTTEKNLEVSKGSYDNRVEIEWSNNKNAVIESFKIQRASYNLLGEVSQWELIGEVSNSVHHFTDLYTNANEFYNYQILCYVPCETDTSNNENTSQSLQSNVEVGFRYIEGQVLGTSSYEDSQPVSGVKVSSQVDNQKNKSKLIRNSFDLDSSLFSNSNINYGIGLWVKKQSEDCSIISIANNFNLETNTDSAYNFNQWHYVFVQFFQNDSTQIYVDGNHTATHSGLSNLSLITIGGDKGLFIDELSLWKSIPSQYDGKYLSARAEGLMAYYHCDEPQGVAGLFDYSKNEFGLGNNNHLVLDATAQSGDVFPLAQKCYTYTDSIGQYHLKGIRISGLGSLIKITPSTDVVVVDDIILDPVHEFNPPFLTVYLGDGNSMQNFNNFIDISSFDVSGNVFYLDPNKSTDSLCKDSDQGEFGLNDSIYLVECDSYIPRNGTNSVADVGVEGASVLVDGELVYDLNGNQVYTNANGAFNVKVPIGRHQLSVEKEGHTFVNQIWNSGDHSSIKLDAHTANAETRIVYNFVQNKPNLLFYDNTVRTLVGRVCGGTTQATKVYGKLASVNNIGEAAFVLSNVGTEIHSVLLNTDELSGEYVAKLLPIQYQLKANGVSGKTLKIDTHSKANTFFNIDNGSGQPYPFPTIDLSSKGAQFNYDQAFYDNIINREILNVFGKNVVFDSIANDSVQVIADSTLLRYYQLIDSPNSIYINSNNKVYTQDDLVDGAVLGQTIPDDFTKYPHLFGINHEITRDSIVLLTSDSFSFDHSENFIYRVEPLVKYYTGLWNPELDDSSIELPYLGEFNWEIINQVWNEVDEVWEDGEDKLVPNLVAQSNAELDYVFGKPIFKKNKNYTFFCEVEEVYKKYAADGQIVSTDQVPVETGTITLNDGVLSNSYQVNSSSIEVPFIPFNVNTSLNGDNSFSQSFTFTYSQGVVSVDSNQDFYVFGSRPDEGTTFFSTGPEVVEMILRDPPGDQSYSYIESGTTFIQEVEVTSIGEAVSDHLEKDINLGTELTFTLPFGGPVINTEIILNTQIDIEFESLIDTTENSIIENTYTVGYQTSAEEYNIGSGGDLFIAKNYNILYGTNKYLEIVDTSFCVNQGIVCLGEESSDPSALGNGGAVVLYVENADSDTPVAYTLGTSVGLDVVPTGFETKTAYDQNHIVHTLIPTLKWIRNTYFGMAAYELMDNSNPCFDNTKHPNYSQNNLNPCYDYHEAMDNLDPYELPFNALDDIDLYEFIPDGFVDLVSNYMLQSVDANGDFMGFTEESLEALELIASTAEVGSNVMSALDDIASSDFWQVLSEFVGGQNLLVGIDAFKEEFLAGQIDKYSGITGGIETLTTLVDNMSHSVPKDKVAFFNQQIRLWEDAVALNEEDKSSIIEVTQQGGGAESSQSAGSETHSSAAQLVVNSPLLVYGAAASVFESATGYFEDPIGPDENVSFSAGNTIQNTQISTETEVVSHTINYTIEGDIAFEIGGKINGFGGSYNNNIPITFEVEKKVSDTESQGVTVGYVLSDNDESDFISVDVKQSNMGFGPIFRKRGGQTMCPHEGEESFLYFDGAIVSQQDGVFADATQPREVPGIDIFPKTLSNVPEMEQAVFSLSLTNNSAAMQDMVYSLMVDESSNPHGAILLMDGLSVYRDVMVPYGQTITKTLTVQKGPEHLSYIDNSDVEGGQDNRLSIILRSPCQYNYGTSNTPDIADTVKFAVSFLAGCSPIAIAQPVHNFVINKLSENLVDGTNTNVVSFELDAYNYNYYSLDNIYLQYKKSNEPVAAFATQQIVKFQKIDQEGETLETGFDSLIGGSVLIEFDTQNWEDGGYDLRAYTDCQIASEESLVISGYKDTRLPEPFGSPSPADGILEPNDEVALAWSETIDENKFYSPNTRISVTTVKNFASVRHDAYLLLDSEDLVSIPVGLNLKNSSFTIEMWVNPSQEGVLFEQGYDEKLSLSITSDKKLKASYTGSDDLEITSSSGIVFNDWNHVAFVFDNSSKTMSFILNGSLVNVEDIHDFSRDYQGEGPVSIGASYQGAIHNLKIWSTHKSTDAIYANLLNRLSGNEAGLLGYWPMDELKGSPQDLARNRHLIGDVNWAIAQKGKGLDFSSSQSVLNAEFGTVAYNQTDDFTLEFWFKTAQVNQTILSNGSFNTDNNLGNLDAWSFGLNMQGKLIVSHGLTNGATTLMSSNNSYANNQWHHVALVKNSKANTTLFVDGEEQSTLNSEQTNGFGGAQLTLGAKSYRNSVFYEYSNHYSGLLDEFRVWNMKRTLSQLERYKNIRLNGDEIGLHVYYPFEAYQMAAGVALITAETNDRSGSLDLEGTMPYTDDLPLIRMHNPVEGVEFSRIANGDQTLLSLTEDFENIEACILDVSMENVSDLYANNSNPVSWSFFVDKNQLIWDEFQIKKEKLLGESLVFETDIINKGGAVEQFEISNLPNWLTASPSEGIIDPNSHTSIEFFVNDALFIGDYQQDVMLTGNNGYAERLDLSLEVEELQPSFDLDPSLYQYGMNFIGKVSVDAIRSRDEKDLLFAYVGQEIRGTTELVYIDGYDAYFAFLTVYSNSVSGEQISFRLWDASEGKIQSQVGVNSDSNLSVNFIEGAVVGSFDELTNFKASNVLRQEIPLNEGWNWVSFNLNNQLEQDNLSNVLQIPTIMKQLDNQAVSVFRSQTKYAEYYGSNSDGAWYGSMTEVPISQMYMINIDQADTIVYEGLTVHTDSVPIDINPGWNWISYLGQRTMGINDLLASLNPESGDVIKSKTAFSMYASESLGWLGTLSNMNSGEGFMMKSTNAGTLVYPNSSMYSGGSFRLDRNQYQEKIWNVDAGLYENSMSVIAQIDHLDYIKPDLANVLGAFSADNCMGNISVTSIDQDRSLYFLTVNGHDEAPIHFEYFDAQKERVYQTDNKVMFKSNNVIGTIEAPYLITIADENDHLDDFGISIYPNPFKELFEVNFTLDNDSAIKIELFDAIGRKIKTVAHKNLEAGLHHLAIDGEELTKGIYFVELTMGNQSAKKMIVKY